MHTVELSTDGLRLGGTEDQGTRTGLVDVVMPLATARNKGVQLLDILGVDVRVDCLARIASTKALSSRNVFRQKNKLTT
jgi:hypothetical protein